MAVGIEVRVPFCDHRLVSCVFNVPWSMKTFRRPAEDPAAGRCGRPVATVRAGSSCRIRQGGPEYAPCIPDKRRMPRAEYVDKMCHAWIFSSKCASTRAHNPSRLAKKMDSVRSDWSHP
ncbi:asparagine synthase-related protein [Micromonospora sp. NPDC001898]|uniref:asparagine synthase-related protein n=1 Tax=Micromonospora sp. NPDC001898 TaxID=3364221 RepID=UPI0036C375A3